MKTPRILLASVTLSLVAISSSCPTSAMADLIQTWDFTLSPASSLPSGVTLSGALVYDNVDGDPHHGIIESVSFTINGVTDSAALLVDGGPPSNALVPAPWRTPGNFNVPTVYGYVGGEAGSFSGSALSWSISPNFPLILLGGPASEYVTLNNVGLGGTSVAGAWTLPTVPESSTIWSGVFLSVPLLGAALGRFKRVAV